MNWSSTSPVLDRGFDEVIARLAGTGRASVERHLVKCEKNAQHVLLWKYLVGLLGRLTPTAMPTAGTLAIRFFIPDGKFKLQLFALEDLQNNELSLYCKDVRAAAISESVLDRPKPGSNIYRILHGAAGEWLSIETLTAAGTVSAPEYYKHMLGWNRTAIRITLPVPPTDAQIWAFEQICRLAGPQKGS
jgi:hypothetical protein